MKVYINDFDTDNQKTFVLFFNVFFLETTSVMVASSSSYINKRMLFVGFRNSLTREYRPASFLHTELPTVPL